MHRHKISLTKKLSDVRLQARAPGREQMDGTGPSEQELQSLKEHEQLRQNARILAALEGIQETVNDYEQRRQQSLIDLQKVAVELAMMVASHVVYAELEKESLGVEEFIANAVGRIGILEPATIRLHPADLQLLQNQLQTRSSPWNEKLMTLVADTSIERGAVRLETNSGRVVLSDVNSRIEEIRREWMESIYDAQAEHRRAAKDSKSLRRFPDRRETA